MKVLVFGGAGYIGSHFCHLAADAGHDIVVFDDFSAGHRPFVEKFRVIEGDVADAVVLDKALKEGFDAVCHFAGRISVAESVNNPSLYARSNFENTQTILSALRQRGVERIIFSSTAAVYSSDASSLKLSENAEIKPMNPYGTSKLLAERAIDNWVEGDKCNRAVVFRYFNAAGAGTDYGLGEAHDPETHLIPNAIYSGLGVVADPLMVFGSDYPTKDGTCIRDFVHVLDIASAHLLALNLMDDLRDRFSCFNLGSGDGFTVGEVIAECERQLELVIPKVAAPRRDGDLPRLVASSDRAREMLEWQPLNSSLENIVSTAIEWHRNIQPRVFA